MNLLLGHEPLVAARKMKDQDNVLNFADRFRTLGSPAIGQGLAGLVRLADLGLFALLGRLGRLGLARR
jgi:hypothetical protein